MIRNTQSEFTLRDLYRAVFRHKWKTFSFFLAVMVPVTAITFLVPRTYRSEGKLFVRLGRENATLDPTTTLGQNAVLAIPQSRDSEINSVVEILRGRLLAEKVTDAVGPGVVLGSSSEPGPDARILAVRKLMKKLGVDRVRKTNVILVTYEGQSPELAQIVVTKLIEFFLDEHIRLNRTSGAHDFLTEQTARLKKELTRREEELSELENETGLISPGSQREIAVSRIGRLEDELSTTAAAISGSKAKVGALRKQLEILPKNRIDTQTTGFANEAADGMREELYRLQLKEQELLSKLTEAHPKVQAIRRQTAAAREVFGGEERVRKQITSGPSKAEQEARLVLVVEGAALKAAESSAEALRSQLADARQAIKILNANELRIAKLQREIQLYDGDYRRYSTSLEQSRIDHALELGKISNISVVQPATYETKPVSPRRRVNLALGLLVGVLGGLGLALLLEYLDHSLETPEDIETKLGLPTLVSIPRIRARQLVLDGRN